MGKTRTPKYVARLSYVSFINRRRETLQIEYRASEHGTPSEVNAKKFRQKWNESLEKGGTNYHLNATQSHYGTIQIVRQKDKAIMATFRPPMFEVVETEMI